MLDEIDLRILAELQKNGRLANNELASRVGLTPAPCLRRVRALEADGAIRRYMAVINPVVLGRGLTVFAHVRLQRQDSTSIEEFTNAVMPLPEVVECYLMAGESDFLLRIVARDLTDYRQFQVEHLTRLPGVTSIRTDIPLQNVKSTPELPVPSPLQTHAW